MNIILLALIILICVFIGISLSRKHNNSINNEFYDVVSPNNNYGFVPIETNKDTRLINEDPELEEIREYDIMNNQIYERNQPDKTLYNYQEDRNNNSIVSVKQILPYFNDIKFSQDYRDVITSINDLVPAKKQIFNMSNIPLLSYSTPKPSEVVQMSLDFIDTLNSISKQNTEEFDNRKLDGNLNYGWTDKLVEKNVESGWDKTQKALGLRPSLYPEPAKYRPVSLVAIKKVQKYETDDETKYVIYLVLHKSGVIDQILLKISLVINKTIARDENEFLKVKLDYQNNEDYTFKPNFNVSVVVEDIDIMGYFTNKYGGFKSEDFGILYMKYDDLEFSNMTSNKYIRKVLIDKYNKRNDEINKRNATLDDDGREFHASMSGVGDYCNLGLSATIFDDIDAPRLFC